MQSISSDDENPINMDTFPASELLYGDFHDYMFMDILYEKTRQREPNALETDILNEIIPQILSEYYELMDKNYQTVSKYL